MESLYNALDAFSSCTGVPVTAYDMDGSILYEFLPERKICSFLPQYHAGADCQKNLRFSTELSFDLGEPYIFSCAAGLVLITVPVLLNKKKEGSIAAGPLVLGSISEPLLNKILEMNPGDASLLSRVAFFFRELREYTPEQVQKIATLLYGAVLSGHRNWDEYEQIRAKQRSQTHAGEAVRKHKQESVLVHTGQNGTDLEERLVRELQGKNRAAAEKTGREIMEEIILVEGGNFDIIKMRLFERFVFLCQTAMDTGVSLQKIFGVGFDPIEGLNKAQSIDELEDWFRQILNHFSGQVFTAVRQGHSEIIIQAMEYIEENVARKLTLHELANALHINESYLSKLFKKELTVSFTDYVNEIRINKSIRLLEETNLSMLEIAMQVGFEDQSYFTKIFKKNIGQTPKKYKAGRGANALMENEYMEAFFPNNRRHK